MATAEQELRQARRTYESARADAEHRLGKAAKDAHRSGLPVKRVGELLGFRSRQGVYDLWRRVGLALALAIVAGAMLSPSAEAGHDLGGRYWAEQPIKVIDYGVGHARDRQHWRSTRDAAFDEWEASGVVRFRVRERRGPNCEADREGVAAAKLITPPGRIALCRMRSGNPLTGGYALISGPRNRPIREATVAVRSPNALCHEIGHAIGLGHPAVASDHFMGSCLGWGGLHPGPHDLEMLRLIYGPHQA